MAPDMPMPSLLATFSMIVAGLVALSLAMTRHQLSAHHRVHAPMEKLWSRAAGWCLIGIAALIAMSEMGWPVGLVALTGLATFGALLVALIASYRPTALPAVRITGIVVAVFAAAVRLLA